MGYFAPEAEYPKSDLADVSVLVRPTSRSNVYQVGVTMLSAMTGLGYKKDRGDVGLVYTQAPEWNDMVVKGQWAGYSLDLIDLVEICVRFDMADRPSPQMLLAMIQSSMPKHADGMDRWGTLSWIKHMSSEIDKSLAADDDTQMDDDAGTGATTGQKRKATTGQKRKASEPPESAPDAKRVKAQDALERRLAYVAAFIKGDWPRPQVHKDDHPLEPHRINRLVYNEADAMFNPDTFFDTADPGPIEFFELDDGDENRLEIIMIEDSEDDGQAHKP